MFIFRALIIMPPKKKARSSAAPPKAQTRVKADPHMRSQSGSPQTQLSLSALATELILHIIELAAPIDDPDDFDAHLDREDLLFELSRTCSALRGITLSMKWESFDVTRTRYDGGEYWYMLGFSLRATGSRYAVRLVNWSSE